jgi:hypothetical protein
MISRGDGVEQIYGPLRERAVFDAVSLDGEAHTLVWPNGADFDPVTLHDWPMVADELRELARGWKRVE